MTVTAIRKKRLFTLITLAGSVLLASLGISIASVALPTLSQVFPAPVSSIQWVVLGYLMAVTISIASAGRCGDVWGHRRVLITGLIIFTLASIACALATNLSALIAARLVQGGGAAILMALPLSIIRDVVEKERTGLAIGLLGTVSALGTALGPSLGGVLIDEFGWRAAFALLAGISTLLLGLSFRALPATEARLRQTRRSMDWLGLALLTLTLGAYALLTSGSAISLPWREGTMLLVCVVALALFVMVEARVSMPLVPVSLLRDRLIVSSLATNFLVTTVLMSTLVVGPFFLFFGLQLNQTSVGLVMAVGPITAALFGIPAGRLTDKFGTSRIMFVGLVQMALSLLCLAFLPRCLGVWGYILSLMLLTPGFQLFLAANSTAVMLAAKEEQRGILSGLLGLSRNLGFMTGASVMVTLFGAALGKRDIAALPTAAIGDAFATTFLAAAAMVFLAIVIFGIARIKAAEAGLSRQPPAD